MIRSSSFSLRVLDLRAWLTPSSTAWERRVVRSSSGLGVCSDVTRPSLVRLMMESWESSESVNCFAKARNLADLN